jgi:hypothetical protein
VLKEGKCATVVSFCNVGNNLEFTDNNTDAEILQVKFLMQNIEEYYPSPSLKYYPRSPS